LITDLKLRLILQTGVSCTVFVARQCYQRGILRWSWKETFITIKWDTASWCDRNSCKKCCALFYFRLELQALRYKFVWHYDQHPHGA